MKKRHFDAAIAMSRKSVSEGDLLRFEEFKRDSGHGGGSSYSEITPA